MKGMSECTIQFVFQYLPDRTLFSQDWWPCNATAGSIGNINKVAIDNVYAGGLALRVMGKSSTLCRLSK